MTWTVTDMSAVGRSGTSDVRRADWVTTRSSEGQRRRPVGFVKRCARDGKWADVRWKSGTEEWVKRMRCKHLVVLAEIPFMMDLTRNMAGGTK